MRRVEIASQFEPSRTRLTTRLRPNATKSSIEISMQESPAFAPLPVRARDTLEILDTAVKLYKRYFWVLIAWSAIASLAPVILQTVTFGIGGFLSFLFTPLLVGATACCIAAAVRGQNVGFKQCWHFTKPRFWPIVGQYLLCLILGFLGIAALIFICVLLCVPIAIYTSGANLAVQIVMWLVIGLVLLTVFTILSSVISAWMAITPLIVCLEDDRRGGSAQARAWDLIKKHWLRVTGLLAIVGLAGFAALGVAGGFGVLLVGIPEIERLMSGQAPSGAGVWAGLASMGFIWFVAAIGFSPALYLIMAVLYLDLRVRKEALDLEWSAHVSAPAVPASPAVAMVPQAIETPVENSAFFSPASFGAAPVAPELPSVGEPEAPSPFAPPPVDWNPPKMDAEPARVELETLPEPPRDDTPRFGA